MLLLILLLALFLAPLRLDRRLRVPLRVTITALKCLRVL
jgi:hypothetical protein